MSEATRLFDSDEDLDLTDTKLHASDEDDDDEELIKYIDLPGKVTSSDGKYIESFEFKPLTSPSTKAKEKTKVTNKNAPIVLLSDTESDVEEVEVKRETSFLSEPPDYESPEEDERTDVKRTGFGDVHKDSSGEMGYKELLELCGQDVGDDDNEMEYDDNYHHVDDSDDSDDETYYSGTTKIKTKTHLKRKSPYSVKDRNKPIKGKGKRPVSGMRKFKSSSQGQKSPESTGTDQNLVVVDSARPICFGDRPVDLNAPIVEEISVIPPPPLMCEACEKETSHNSMVQCCDGHLDCMRCVEASAKKVLVGEKKGSVECPQSDCTSSVPLSELRKALPAIVLDLLEDKWNRETMEALENMKDAVKCPGCNYSAVLDMAVKRFQCLQCNEAFCRYCDRKWTERKTHDLCIRTKQWTSTVTGNVVNIPAQWSDPDTDSVDGRSKSHTIVELDKSSAEFCDVVHFMNKDMSSNVKKIFRIQNERLWEKYSLSRSHMVADLGELNINEKRLFHGTHNDVIEAICKEGFDWRLCGKHGTVYGQGTYFAKSPWLSHQYSSGNSSRRGRPNIGGSGFPFGLSTIPPPQYKPPLRFGGSATGTSQSGFTFGGNPVTAASTGFTFGQSKSVPKDIAGFGSADSAYQLGLQLGASHTGNSGFSFGPASTWTPVTSVTLPATVSSKHLFKFSSPKTVSNSGCKCNTGASGVTCPAGGNGCTNSLPHPNLHCNQQQNFNIPSNTSTDPSALKKSCSNCIFCTPKRKATDPVSTTASSSAQTVSVPSSIAASNVATLHKVNKDLLKFAQGNSGANLFVKVIPPNSISTTNNGNSGSGFPFLSSSGNTGSGFSFGLNTSSVSSGSGFSFGPSSGNSGSGFSGGSCFNTSGHGGTTFGNIRRSGLNIDDSSDTDCFMFLARVLVGRSCVGTHKMRRPEKVFGGRETHSAVDNPDKPRIFVIFDNNQCYPEYIIQYSTSSSG